MNTEEFLSNLTAESKEIFMILDKLIRKYDQKVKAEIGPVMSVKEALVYHQDGVFKYGITKTKNHYSLHSMVMYAYPELANELKKESQEIKFQKGCLNFQSIDQIDQPHFENFIKESANKDFSPVMDHYKKKKK